MSVPFSSKKKNTHRNTVYLLVKIMYKSMLHSGGLLAKLYMAAELGANVFTVGEMCVW